MQSRVLWSEQVGRYVQSKAPEPRRAIWQAIKNLSAWDGKENQPLIVHLEDDLSGYNRVRIKGERVIFREDFENGQRVIKCIFAGPRLTVYDAFRELLLDELAG